MKSKFSIVIGMVLFIVTICNGQIFSNKGAMPITVNNINTYLRKQNIISQSISLGDTMMDKIIKTYKVPLDEMGYDFDATIINTTKVLKRVSYNRLAVTTFNILNSIMQYVSQYPQESVDKGFVKQDTRDKILTYLKYSEFNENIILALNYVKKCQRKYNGLCSANQYAKILLDNKFLDPNRHTSSPLPKSMLSVFESNGQKSTSSLDLTTMFMSKIKHPREFGKYIEDINGNEINVNFLFSEYTKSFRLKNNVQKIIDGYNPWWIK